MSGWPVTPKLGGLALERQLAEIYVIFARSNGIAWIGSRSPLPSNRSKRPLWGRFALWYSTATSPSAVAHGNSAAAPPAIGQKLPPDCLICSCH
jgi:hypothetical protein